MSGWDWVIIFIEWAEAEQYFVTITVILSSSLDYSSLKNTEDKNNGIGDGNIGATLSFHVHQQNIENCHIFECSPFIS